MSNTNTLKDDLLALGELMREGKVRFDENITISLRKIQYDKITGEIMESSVDSSVKLLIAILKDECRI